MTVVNGSIKSRNHEVLRDLRNSHLDSINWAMKGGRVLESEYEDFTVLLKRLGVEAESESAAPGDA
jgi:hypothetical protein